MALKSLLVGAALAVVTAGAANAESILYRNDASIGTDYLGAAVNASGATVTSTGGDLSSFTLSSYNVVVYANQNNSIPSGDLAALNTYIAGGGKVIFDDWTQSSNFNGGEFFDGQNNQTTLTLGPTFATGIVGPLSVVNPGWGTFSTGLTVTEGGGVVVGTFENGDGGIVVGNGGRTIVNGFLSDTVASQRLYANELGSFAVPEPATWALMLVGVGGLGASLRSRRKAVLAA